MLQHYWYVGAVISAVYTIGACWWTVAAERRIRTLQRTIAAVCDDVTSLRGNASTGRWPAAKKWLS